MSKQVRFDDNVQEHTMSVDGNTHRQEVQDPAGAGIPMMSPPTYAPMQMATKPLTETAGFMGLSWWWILLIILVAVVVGYFGWRYYTKKPVVKPEPKSE